MSVQTVKLYRPHQPITQAELDAVMEMASHSGWQPSRWHDGEPHFDGPFGSDDLRVLFTVARVLGAQCVPGEAAAPARSFVPQVRVGGGAGPAAQILAVMAASLLLSGFVDGLTHHSGAAGLALAGGLAAAYGLSRRSARLTR